MPVKKSKLAAPKVVETLPNGGDVYKLSGGKFIVWWSLSFVGPYDSLGEAAARSADDFMSGRGWTMPGTR